MNNEKKLKNIFSDIIKGYSLIKNNIFGSVYIKHLNNFDISDVDLVYKEALDNAIKLKIPTEEQQEEYILKDGGWTKKQNEKIDDIKQTINIVDNNLSREFLKSKRDVLKAQLENLQEDLKKIEIEKRILIGITAESFAIKKSNEFYIKNVFYKNKELTELLFNDEQFDDLEDSKLRQLTQTYESYVSDFSSGNLRKISISPFFLNIFYLSPENPVNFYGKPVIYLTFYQADLYGYGQYFKNVLSEYKDKIPKDIMDNPDLLLEYVECNKNADKVLGRDKEDSKATMYMGAKKEDLKYLGIDSSQIINLNKESKGKKQLSFEELAKIHGE